MIEVKMLPNVKEKEEFDTWQSDLNKDINLSLKVDHVLHNSSMEYHHHWKEFLKL